MAGTPGYRNFPAHATVLWRPGPGVVLNAGDRPEATVSIARPTAHHEKLMARSRFTIRSPSHSSPVHWLLASISIIPLDYFTGPYLDSMVLLYPIPAAMAAWSGSPRWSIALAAALPPVRMLIFHYWGWQAPALEAVLDTVVIVLFSIAIALLILHLRRQALTLRVLGGMLPICGFCKRIRNGDAWEPLEGFITNHSEAEFSHTFCDECGSKHYPDYLAP
jgi:hypothetical protein